MGSWAAINHQKVSFLYQNALWAQIESSNNSAKTTCFNKRTVRTWNIFCVLFHFVYLMCAHKQRNYWYNCLQSDVVCVQYLGTVTRSQTEKDWFNIYLAENWKNGAIVSISLALHKPSHKLRTKMSVKDVNCCSNFIIPSSVRF